MESSENDSSFSMDEFKSSNTLWETGRDSSHSICASSSLSFSATLSYLLFITTVILITAELNGGKAPLDTSSIAGFGKHRPEHDCARK